MKIIFMGTPDFALPTLNALVDAGHEIVAVYSQPARPAGRGKAPRPSPVEKRARELGLNVYTPVSLKEAETQKIFADHQADVAVVAAYGCYYPRPFLNAAPWLFKCAWLSSPEMAWRTPVQRAILAGDQESGVTIMQMDRGLDTGAMLKIEKTPIADKNAGALSDEIAHIGAKLMVEVLAQPEQYPPVKQPESGESYAAKIDKSEALIDFSKRCRELNGKFALLPPKPGAFFLYNEERIRILEAHVQNQAGAVGKTLNDHLLIGCGSNSLQPVIVQRAGRKAMKLEDNLRGFAIPRGTRLS
uniref:Methionyl-tRNA formyltransferase n=1 Tax=Zymomonas mobilis TaxID=542 RepID=Q9REQ1_ZYMMB|nr:methionyl-tRNA formyltransferase [Zymomonas mobilis subsp. mobilis ZM4 = ATCC 31821]